MKYIKLYEQREPERRVARRPDGSVERELWYLDGNLHREDGPARIEYRPDGSVEWEEWYLNGKRHRPDGPAWIEYRPDGSVEWEQWWLNGNRLDKVTNQGEFEAWKYLKSVGLV